jgi:DNA ligase-1
MNTIDFTGEQFEEIKVAADWIRDLESSDSRLHKESVIEKALMASKLGSSNAQCFLFNCYQAYNPYYVFGVKKVLETEGLEHKPNPWPKFWAMLEGLRTRSLTGHNAKTAIEFMSEQFDSVEWNTICRRVIIKDLRCGISEKTLNKVLGNTEWKIPVFTCQLAQDSGDHPSKMKGTKRLEGKLDGVRVLAVVTRNTINLYSRNGKPFDNFPQVEEAISQIASEFSRANFGTEMRLVFDGEIVGKSFQALMKQAQRKSDIETTDMVYHIFDWMPLAEFEMGFCNSQQRKRTEWLEAQRALIESQPCLKVTEGILVDLDTSDGHDQLRRYANDAVAEGLEGIMIKEWEAPYECRRSSFWMKLKPVYDYDLKVVAVEEGTGRNVGKLGALVCEGTDDDRLIRCNVGTGLTDAQRDDYWTNRSVIIGQTAVVLADAVTQNQDGSYSLRFPRFKTFRDDK